MRRWILAPLLLLFLLPACSTVFASSGFPPPPHINIVVGLDRQFDIHNPAPYIELD